MVTHPDKVLFPELGITKQEVLNYYALVAERMLPHVANRPLTLVRCLHGQGKPCFFQKHPGKGTPPGMRSVSIGDKASKSLYSVIDDATGLFGLVQLGALEIHTWGSSADDFEHPDMLVFDLDPDPSLDCAAVIAGAHAIREVFQEAKLESFVKTTGGKGLHVCVPIAPHLDWEHVKAFTENVAKALARRSPELYVTTQSKARRIGKTFIDYLRNGRGATFTAPYSTRARENAPLAIPLEWDELSPHLLPNHFNLRNVQRRLETLKHDPFERMLGAPAAPPDRANRTTRSEVVHKDDLAYRLQISGGCDAFSQGYWRAPRRESSRPWVCLWSCSARKRSARWVNRRRNASCVAYWRPLDHSHPEVEHSTQPR